MYTDEHILYCAMSDKYCSVKILYEAVLTVRERSCLKNYMTCRI